MNWLVRILHKLGNRLSPKYGWFGNYKTWEEANAQCTGYDSSLILEKIKAAALKVKNGEKPYERDGVLFDKTEYSIPLQELIAKAAAENNGTVKVADFGGSLGSSYYQNKPQLDALQDVKWGVIEQSNFVSTGKKYFENGTLRFFYTIEEFTGQLGTPDILLISSTLQYIEEPYQLLDELIQAGAKYIIIENTAFNNKPYNRITIQKVPPQIYTASYPCWLLNYEEVKLSLSRRYTVLQEYTNELFIYVEGKKTPYRGLVLKLKDTE